ncbi:hypothetical protein F5Y15DRAFT_112374 [Xylariaceae sp. FL0016]|nr:hypothetical protein F5Y15DRAFT_112374 [Xylariaceae sp. FL0016]
MPEYERFMSHEMATELGMISVSGCEEKAWWKLFRLLIPNMENRDLASLQQDYSPCKLVHLRYKCVISHRGPLLTIC